MFFLRSGIPSLDNMFRPSGTAAADPAQNRDQHGVLLPEKDGISTLCIAGPDGTGKSALAMHFASRYIADCQQVCRQNPKMEQPLAFYVSSDLSHATAELMWQNFGLDSPNMRRIPFLYPQMDVAPAASWLGGDMYDKDYWLPLKLHQPNELADLADYLGGKTVSSQIAFVDLASHAAGDDWGFVERLLASMPDRTSGSPRHLLVIDAMEGMETFAGDMDAFGQKVGRRGRIAKLIRLARQKCHLIIVSEEPKEGERLPEQFVADVVLRLRTTENHGYTRRSLEIEKARGQSHLRGRHPYVIRDGHGSTTGHQNNSPAPRKLVCSTTCHPGERTASSKADGQCQPHIARDIAVKPRSGLRK